MLRKEMCLLFSVLFVWSAYSQNTGVLSGTVIHALTKQPLAGASIQVLPLEKTGLTDSSGRYRIMEIPAGSYNLSASFVDFQTENRFNVVITSGNENEILFELSPQSGDLSEIVIRSSQRTARAASLQTPMSVQ